MSSVARHSMVVVYFFCIFTTIDSFFASISVNFIFRLAFCVHINMVLVYKFQCCTVERNTKTQKKTKNKKCVRVKAKMLCSKKKILFVKIEFTEFFTRCWWTQSELVSAVFALSSCWLNAFNECYNESSLVARMLKFVLKKEVKSTTTINMHNCSCCK